MTQEQRVSQPHEVVAWVAGTQKAEKISLPGLRSRVWGLGWQQMSSKRTSRLNDNLIVYYLTDGGGGGGRERERDKEREKKQSISLILNVYIWLKVNETFVQIERDI